MTQKTVTRKIPGGKLVRMDVSYQEQIDELIITGDFFLHPEEALESIVSELKQASLPFQPGKVLSSLEKLLDEIEAQLIGASPEDLVSILDEALS
jgi:lipoate-protein ligase A